MIDGSYVWFVHSGRIGRVEGLGGTERDGEYYTVGMIYLSLFHITPIFLYIFLHAEVRCIKEPISLYHGNSVQMPPGQAPLLPLCRLR